MSLTGCSAIPAPYRERGQIAYETGRRIVGMAYEDLRPQITEPLGRRGVAEIGAADAVPQGQQHFCNPAHADAADANKMNALNLCEHIF